MSNYREITIAIDSESGHIIDAAADRVVRDEFLPRLILGDEIILKAAFKKLTDNYGVMTAAILPIPADSTFRIIGDIAPGNSESLMFGANYDSELSNFAAGVAAFKINSGNLRFAAVLNNLKSKKCEFVIYSPAGENSALRIAAKDYFIAENRPCETANLPEGEAAAYFNKAEINALLLAKASISHTHADKADLVDGKVPSSQLPEFSVTADWSDISNKPASFPPAEHTHDIYALNTHTHDYSAVFASISHTHDYSATFAPMVHTHADKADLVDGKIPASELPSYVDDVLEYTGVAKFPALGESGKIYIDTTTNVQYRWSGTIYAEISSSLALGETAATAFPGNRGKALEDAVAALPPAVNLADYTGTVFFKSSFNSNTYEMFKIDTKNLYIGSSTGNRTDTYIGGNKVDITSNGSNLKLIASGSSAQVEISAAGGFRFNSADLNAAGGLLQLDTTGKVPAANLPESTGGGTSETSTFQFAEVTAIDDASGTVSCKPIVNGAYGAEVAAVPYTVAKPAGV